MSANSGESKQRVRALILAAGVFHLEGGGACALFGVMPLGVFGAGMEHF